MKKPIIPMLFLILFLSGCWSSYFIYKVTTPEVLLSSRNDFEVPRPAGDLYWGGMVYGLEQAKTSAGLYKVSEGETTKFLCGFSTYLVFSYCGKQKTKEELNEKFGAKRHAFAFLARSFGGYDCEFDNSQVYMIKDGERVQLKLVNFGNTEVLPYSIISLKKHYRRSEYVARYRTPWIDDELENVEIEVGGFYADGIKAPVLRFRMNYRDSIKWRCLEGEPKPSFFKRKWYDIKDFFQNPQEKYNKNSL
jgi:hypothetical protein